MGPVGLEEPKREKWGLKFVFVGNLERERDGLFVWERDRCWERDERIPWGSEVTTNGDVGEEYLLKMARKGFGLLEKNKELLFSSIYVHIIYKYDVLNGEN